MLTLLAKIRQISGKKTKTLRKKGILPAILYGPKIKSSSLEVDSKEFEKIYQEAGESSLVSLEVEGKKIPVLIHEIQRDPLTDKILHIDFYQASLKEKVEATIPLVFEGVAPVVKESGGTLVKNITEVEVKALPQNLPHKIEVKVNVLKTFEGKFEIVSLVGTFSLDGCHLHISLSDKDGNVIGGHLKEGCAIFTTAEIVISEIENMVFFREMDESTGFKELIVK